MLDYDPERNLVCFDKAQMLRFGFNPFGGPMWRIVASDSRRYIVHGVFKGDQFPTARWELTYPHMANQWILEKWQSAFDFTGTTPELWNADPENHLGPYPSRGEYQMAGGTGIDPHQTNIEKLIRLIMAGTRYSWAEKLAACRLNSTKTELEKKLTIEAIVNDAFPAFGAVSHVGYGGARVGKSESPIIRSANELHLPVPVGKPGKASSGVGQMSKKTHRRLGIPNTTYDIPLTL